ncbi:hypothetical protein [Streptomyces albidochromogenes]|uniref:hypothetical protein n=1 Tax=Streptomyces albidochromogenes TaxID=329524 RepID=UPI00110FACDC|nr:hypothetical protein [Streptomyces albidochromogenes]
MASSDKQYLGAGLQPGGRLNALRLTEQPHAAIGEARRATTVLAQRVRDAHRATRTEHFHRQAALRALPVPRHCFMPSCARSCRRAG